MTSFRKLLQLLLFSSAFAFVHPVWGGSLTMPDERDRQVIESLLLHLLTDSEFKMSRVVTNSTVIILHVRTPEKTGFITRDQLRADIGDHALPEEAETDMRKRNTSANSRPGSFDSVPAFYTNLTFVPKIVVADMSGFWNERFSFGAFEQVYPSARGWADAYLPGYTNDGFQAVVRAEVGPSPHGAMVTALLRLKNGRWVVKWCRISWYA